MPRFFVSPEDIGDSQIVLVGEDAKHLKKVLRVTVGEEITICDTNGMDYECRIVSLEEETVTVTILKKYPCISEPKIKITLFQGIPKGDKMELIIQKAVELGVERIIPVAMERSVAKLDKKEEKKISRWKKIAEAAAKQSGRGKIPMVGPQVLTFSKGLEEAKQLDCAILPYEKEEKQGLRKVCSEFQGQSMGIFIGPEGGFAPEEIQSALDANILPVTLGKRILRTETAGLVTVAIVLYELEDR